MSYCIDQCKASIKYPPDGIPVAITGAAGTGKSFLARLTFEYTLDHKILPPDTRYLVFDCSGLRADSEKLNASFFGEQGYLSRDKPVFIVFKEAHLLPGSFQLHLVSFFEKLDTLWEIPIAPVPDYLYQQPVFKVLISASTAKPYPRDHYSARVIGTHDTRKGRINSCLLVAGKGSVAKRTVYCKFTIPVPFIL